MPQIESMNGEPPNTGGLDPLLEVPEDDPIFQSAEPYKGLPASKDIIRAMPEDGRRLLQNSMLGAKAAAERANATLREADAARAEAVAAKAEAEAAKAEWEARLAGAAPAQSPATTTAPAGFDSPFFRRAAGLEEADPYEGRAIPEVDLTVDEELAQLKEDGVFSDGALAVLGGLLKKVANTASAAAVKAARDDMTYTGRESAKPMLLAMEANAAAARAAAAQTEEQKWRAAHPGTETDEGWADFYNYTREVHGLKDAEGWPMQKPSDWEVNHRAWQAERGAVTRAAVTTPPVVGPTAAPTAPAAAPAPAQPRNTVSDLVSHLRADARSAQGGGGLGIETGDLVMPESVKADPASRARWIAQNPVAAQAFAEGDQTMIRKIMGSTRDRLLNQQPRA